MRRLARVLVVASTSAGLSSCDVGDAICTDRTIEEDLDDDCPYGPPGGPQKKTKAGGCEFTFTPEAPECADVTFADDVYPILTSPQPAGGPACSNAFCHGPGTPGSADMLIEDEALSPSELYAILAAVRNDAGEAYVGEDDPKAWFVCNVSATLGGGVAMPPTSGFTAAPTELAVLETWVKCGMKNDGGGVGGMGAGGMDTGGGGGL